MSAAVMPAHMFTLAFELLTGRIVVREPATYPQVNRVGSLVNGMADRGLAFNIAVYDDRGEDVTDLFPCFT